MSFLLFFLPILALTPSFATWVAWLGLSLFQATWRCLITPFIVTGSIFTYRPIPERKDHLDIAGIEHGPPAWQETALSITQWLLLETMPNGKVTIGLFSPTLILQWKNFFARLERKWDDERREAEVLRRRSRLRRRSDPSQHFVTVSIDHFNFHLSLRFGQFYKNQDDPCLVILLHMMQRNEKYFIALMSKHHNLKVVFLTHKSTLWAPVVITSLRIISHGPQPIKAPEKLYIVCSTYLDHE